MCGWVSTGTLCVPNQRDESTRVRMSLGSSFAGRWQYRAWYAALLVLVGCVLFAHRPADAVEVQGPVGHLSANGYIEGGMIFRTDRDSPQQHPAGIFDLKLT